MGQFGQTTPIDQMTAHARFNRLNARQPAAALQAKNAQSWISSARSLLDQREMYRERQGHYI